MDKSIIKNEEDKIQENIWEKILKEASRNINNKVELKNILILGDRLSGKSSLVARLKGLDITELPKSIALDYSFIDILEDDEIISRLNIWTLEGEIEHKNLLKFALNNQTISNTLIIITLDFSQPWIIIDSLNKWLKTLEEYINKNIIPELDNDFYENLKKSLIYNFQQYLKISTSADDTKIVKKKYSIEEELLPLDKDTFTYNFGIPIIVVCCKTDYITQLEKEFNYKESHFDYIQTYLRKICLQYGAGLLYTSAKKNINCDILLQYIRFILYGFNFSNNKPQLLDKETLFIPAGADSFNKIKSDFENQSLTNDFDELYSEIIKIPKKKQYNNTISIGSLIVAEDDQEFLLKYKDILDKENLTEKDKKKSAIKTTTELLDSLKKPSITKENITTTTMNSSITKALPISTSSLTSDSIKDEHQVLENFFNNLIQKNPLGSKTNLNKTSTNREELTKQLEKIKNKK